MTRSRGTRRRALRALGAITLLGAATHPVYAPRPAGAAPAVAGAPAVYFPETGHHLRAGFLDHWRRRQGPARLGPPLNEEQWDAGVGGMAQTFRYGRLEWRATPWRATPSPAIPGAPAAGETGEIQETLGAPDAPRAVPDERALAPVPRDPGVPDWTIALAPAAPAIGATPDPPRQGRAFVVAVDSDDPAGPLTVTGSLAPAGPPEPGVPLRFFSGGETRSGYLSVAALPMGDAPRSWAVTAVVRNALGLDSPPQTAILSVADGGFPLQRLAIQGDLVPLLDPQVGRRENLTLAAIMAESGPEPLWRGRFLQPVPGSLVTVHGARRTYVDPAGQAVGSSQHAGVDLGAPFGAPILAPAAGVVAFAGAWSIRGNVVVLDHGAGVHSLHAHASSIGVVTGEPVARGQIIARVGSTGLSTGPHLHWEVRVGGLAVEPLEWTQRPDLAIA